MRQLQTMYVVAAEPRLCHSNQAASGESLGVLLSRCTQFPEYVLKGHYAAPKSRNPPCVLYSNPGTEVRQGNGMGSFWHSNPGQTLA